LNCVSHLQKFNDATVWVPRIKSGLEALLASALKGKGNTSARGGGPFSDFEVARGVVCMGNAGGAKFSEPKAPAK
jgi:cytochrome c5